MTFFKGTIADAIVNYYELIGEPKYKKIPSLSRKDFEIRGGCHQNQKISKFPSRNSCNNMLNLYTIDRIILSLKKLSRFRKLDNMDK